MISQGQLHTQNYVVLTMLNVLEVRNLPQIYTNVTTWSKWNTYAIPLKLTTAFLIILCVIQLHSTYLLWPECWQIQITWAVKLTFIILCQPRFRCPCSTFCLSVSYNFNMSSHLAVPLSHLPFIAISHPRFSAPQACPVPLSRVKSCVKMKPEIAGVKMSFIWLVSLCYIFNAKWNPSMTQIIHSIQCLLQNIGQLLIISSEFSLRGVTKSWICKLGRNLKLHDVKVYVHCVQHAQLIRVIITWYILISQENIFCTVTYVYDVVILWTAITSETHDTHCWEFLGNCKNFCHSFRFCNNLWHSRP